MIYAVQASVVTTNGVARQVPTFFLDSTVQGIVNGEHAARIGRDVLASVLPSDHNARIHVFVAWGGHRIAQEEGS